MMGNNLQSQVNGPVRDIVIVGADVIGWCAAVGLARGLQGQKVNITLLDTGIQDESPDSVIHCTEHLFDFHRLLGIQEKQLLINGNAKLCSARHFKHFSRQNPDFFIGCEKTQAHFCSVELHHILRWLKLDNLAPYSLSALAAEQVILALPTNSQDAISAGFSPFVNLDSAAYLRFMQGAAEHLGVKRVKGTVAQVHVNPENGFISQYELSDGSIIQADFVVDNCTQIDSLKSNLCKQSYVDVSHLSPFDKKISGTIPITHQAKPYQQFIANPLGIIEMQFMPDYHCATLHYCGQNNSEQQARQLLQAYLPGIEKLKVCSQSIGYRNEVLYKNCFSLGAKAGNLGISPFSQLILSQRSISKLLELFPGKACLAANTAELNRRIADDYQQALLYGLLMLMFTEDEAQYYWQLGLPQLPEALQHRVQLFSSSGRVTSELNPLISRDTWLTLLKYKVRRYQGYEPVLDALDKNNGQKFLDNVTRQIQSQLTRYKPYY